MVSRREAEDCMDAATKLITSFGGKEPSPANQAKMLAIGLFLGRGVIECIFRIADSLEVIAEKHKLELSI